MPTISACTIHTNSHWITKWLSRGIGVLFFYTSITLSEQVTLQNTPVAQLIQREYPTLTSFIIDLFIPLGILVILFLVLSLMLNYTKHHPVSNNIRIRLKQWDEKMLRNILSFSFFLVHWMIILGVTLIVWFTLIQWITTLLPETLHLPSFEHQIVVALLGIGGLAVFLNSFEWWQKKLPKKWCFRCQI